MQITLTEKSDPVLIEQIAVEKHNFEGDDFTLPWEKQKSSYRGSVRKQVRQLIASLNRSGYTITKDSK